MSSHSYYGPSGPTRAFQYAGAPYVAPLQVSPHAVPATPFAYHSPPLPPTGPPLSPLSAFTPMSPLSSTAGHSRYSPPHGYPPSPRTVYEYPPYTTRRRRDGYDSGYSQGRRRRHSDASSPSAYSTPHSSDFRPPLPFRSFSIPSHTSRLSDSFPVHLPAHAPNPFSHRGISREQWVRFLDDIAEAAVEQELAGPPSDSSHSSDSSGDSSPEGSRFQGSRFGMRRLFRRIKLRSGEDEDELKLGEDPWRARRVIRTWRRNFFEPRGITLRLRRGRIEDEEGYEPLRHEDEGEIRWWLRIKDAGRRGRRARSEWGD